MSQNKNPAQLSALSATDAAEAANLALAYHTAGSGIKTKSVRFDVLMGALGRLSQVYHVSDPRFGASASNTGAQNIAAVQACHDAMPSGATMEMDALTLNFAGTINITKPINIDCFGATLTQQTSNTTFFNVTAGGVKFRGDRAGSLTGPQYASQVANEIAIKVTGTDSSHYADGFDLDGLQITGWGMYGLYMSFVKNFDIRHFRITNIRYAGILGSSVQDGTCEHGTIDGVAHTPNAYGIAWTRAETSSLVTDPRSADITTTNVTAKNVTNWEGFDTHAGLRIVFDNCKALNCKTGFAIGSGDNASQVPTYAPIDCHVRNGIADSGVTDGSATAGVSFTGAQGTVGASVAYATGSIVNTLIRGHGQESNDLNGGIFMRDTLGVVVKGNPLHECSPSAILLYHDNYGVVVEGNPIVDAWSNTATLACGIRSRNDYNTGSIGPNPCARGSKSATHVLDAAVRIDNNANTSITLVPNHGTAATAQLTDTGGHARANFFGAGAVKQTVSGSRGANAALTSLLTALAAYGLVTDSSS